MDLPALTACLLPTQAPPPAMDWEGDGELKREVLEVFTAFAMYGAGSGGASTPRTTSAVELDGARFAKLCREAGLLGGRLNTTAVDLVFSKVRGKVGPTHTHVARGSHGLGPGLCRLLVALRPMNAVFNL